MMRTLFATIFCIAISSVLYSQSKDLQYYLPDIKYNEDIPTPEAFLGYQVGDWHVSHDQLHMYMRELAEKSDRILLEEYARSHENRPLLVLKISSPENLQNLEQIRQRHLAICEPGTNQSVNNEPVIIYQGYSIHGNEPSGSNAALLVAYYLAAGESQEVKDMLDNAVILLDPSFNPDGLHRFSSWVNMHKNKNLTSDPSSREYNEVWPRGRTNHYWFDLNRDWLLLTHPESQGRVALFHRWKPNILTDHHEMGTNNTFFFQPGIPSRTNPNTPQKNQDLTEKIGEFHEDALDEIGSLYYSKESFDDFYYGKGSTYPDANGCIGILFEQASSRGHLQESANGLLSFPFTIRNQVATSLSTQKAGVALRKDLLGFQQDFYKSSLKKAKSNPVKAYIFKEDRDEYKLKRFLDILQTHNVDVYRLKTDKNIGRMAFPKEHSYIVPLEQAQYTVVKTIFEKVKEFKDSIFYDVSAWTMPLAFDIDYLGLNSSQYSPNLHGSKLEAGYSPVVKANFKQASYGYLIDWADYNAPRLLYQLQSEGIRVKVLKDAFSYNIDNQQKNFDRGTLFVPVANQEVSAERIFELLRSSSELGVSIFAIETGAPFDGPNMGSPQSRTLEKPAVLLMVGNGVSSYESGSMWHQLDQNFGIPVTSGETRSFGSFDLDRYSTIIMSDGSYNSLDEDDAKKMEEWLNGGGTLIAVRRAINWATKHKLANLKRKTNKNNQTPSLKNYASASRNSGAKVIGGSIFEVEMDLTHPLSYGYDDTQMFVFKRDTQFFEKSDNIYATPISYTNRPLQSGYMHQSHQSGISDAAAVVVCGKGRGTVICLVDNPNFRGYWWGSSKMLANAIFMSPIISGSTKQR